MAAFGAAPAFRRCVPRRIKDLIRDLEFAGFSSRPGRGSHRNFTHPKVVRNVTIAGKLGADAHPYQEKIVKSAIEESRK
jgi:predicted RNA binding protein YcfA (HicA-like mRNA interferase family)